MDSKQDMTFTSNSGNTSSFSWALSDSWLEFTMVIDTQTYPVCTISVPRDQMPQVVEELVIAWTVLGLHSSLITERIHPVN